jgi:hypothetical protein
MPSNVTVATRWPGCRRDWRVLEREEFCHTLGCLQFWESFGLPDGRMVPERTIGHRIIEIFAARYPHLARDASRGLKKKRSGAEPGQVSTAKCPAFDVHTIRVAICGARRTSDAGTARAL